MSEYIYLYAICMFVSLLISLLKDNIIKLFLSLTLILCISIIYYIRDFSIGTDTYAYINFFEIIETSNFTELLDFSENYNIEIGFVLISKLILFLVGNYHSVLLTHAIILYCFLIRGFIKLKINFLLVFAAIFSIFPLFFYNFNILRQSIAMAIVLYSVACLLKKENFIFFVMIFFASLIHTSSIICLSFFLIYKFKNFLNRYMLFFGFFSFFFLLFIIKISNILLGKYNFYLQSSESVNPFSIYTLFVFSLIFILSCNLIKKINVEYVEYVQFFNIIILIFLVYNFLLNYIGFSNQGLNRLGFYFMWPVVFLVPILLSCFKVGNTRYVLNFLVFTLYSIFFLYTLYNQPSDIVPFVAGL